MPRCTVTDVREISFPGSPFYAEYADLDLQMTKIDAMLSAIEQKNDSFQNQARQLLEEMREAKRQDSKGEQAKTRDEDSKEES